MTLYVRLHACLHVILYVLVPNWPLLFKYVRLQKRLHAAVDMIVRSYVSLETNFLLFDILVYHSLTDTLVTRVCLSRKKNATLLSDSAF